MGAAEGKNRGGAQGGLGNCTSRLEVTAWAKLLQARLGWGTPRVTSLGSCTQGPVLTDLPASSALAFGRGSWAEARAGRGPGSRSPLPGVLGHCARWGMFEETEGGRVPGVVPSQCVSFQTPPGTSPPLGFQLSTGGLNVHPLAPGQVLSSVGMRSGKAGLSPARAPRLPGRVRLGTCG